MHEEVCFTKGFELEPHTFWVKAQSNIHFMILNNKNIK
jgi:hypothetical protein